MGKNKVKAHDAPVQRVLEQSLMNEAAEVDPNEETDDVYGSENDIDLTPMHERSFREQNRLHGSERDITSWAWEHRA